jgi:chitinase
MRSHPYWPNRPFFLFLLTAILPFCFPQAFGQTALPNHLPKRLVGDYGYWSKYQTPPYSHAQIPYNMLTHINHAGMSFNAGGGLVVPDGFLESELNDEAHAHGVKVLLLLGGDFPGLEASGAVTILVDNILAFEQQYHYDGVDMDWEYPETTGDRQFFVELMAKLRESNPSYTLSIDAAPWGGYGYDVKALQTSLSYFNIMMYDCAGPWTAHGQLNSAIFWDPNDPAPSECEPGGSVQGAADIFLKGVPPQQLNMGTPFYGYYYGEINRLFGKCPPWVLDIPVDDGTCGNYVLTYNYGTGIKQRINQDGWYTTYDPIAYVPYMLRTDGSDGYVTYDDAFSTFYRVRYSDWERGLGGTFMWSLDADYDGHSQDLLTAMYSATVSP